MTEKKIEFVIFIFTNLQSINDELTQNKSIQ